MIVKQIFIHRNKKKDYKTNVKGYKKKQKIQFTIIRKSEQKFWDKEKRKCGHIEWDGGSIYFFYNY